MPFPNVHNQMAELGVNLDQFGSGNVFDPANIQGIAAINALGGELNTFGFSNQATGGQAAPPSAGGASATDPFAFRDPVTGLSFETNAPPLGAELPTGQNLPPGFMQDPATGALELTGGSQSQGGGNGGSGGDATITGGQFGGVPSGGSLPTASNAPGGVFGTSDQSTAIGALGGTVGAGGAAANQGTAAGAGDFSQITQAMDLLSNPSTLDTLKTQSTSNAQVKSQLDSLIKSLQGLGA